MINSINPVSVIQNPQMVQNSAYQTSQPLPQQIQNPNLNGINALAAYNQPVSKPAPKVIEPLFPTILQPEAIKTMPGERVLTPTGTLDCIIQRNDKNTVIYKMDVLAPESAIRKIEYYDNATGKLIREQENQNEIKDGQLPQTFLTEIIERNPDGLPAKATIYYKGKYEQTMAYEHGQESDKVYVVRADNTSLIEEEFKNTRTTKVTSFDEKGQIIQTETKNREEHSIQTVSYKNGIPSKIETRKNEPIPNTSGIDPKQNPNLIPSQPFVLGYDPKQVQGEKRFFSNGVLHSIKTTTAKGEVCHTFDVTGRLTGIETDQNKTVIFHNNPEPYAAAYSIEEKLTGNVLKTTTFNNDGSKMVTVANQKEQAEKTAMYSKDNNLECYFEKENDNNIMLSYDKQGNLIQIS